MRNHDEIFDALEEAQRALCVVVLQERTGHSTATYCIARAAIDRARRALDLPVFEQSRYFYAMTSFDESLPLPLREAFEALAKAQHESPDPDAKFDVLEENLRMAMEKYGAPGPRNTRCEIEKG